MDIIVYVLAAIGLAALGLIAWLCLPQKTEKTTLKERIAKLW